MDSQTGTKGEVRVPRMNSQIRQDEQHTLTTPIPVRAQNGTTPSTHSHYRIIFGHMPEILSPPKRQQFAGQMILSPEEFSKFQPKKADPLFPQLGLAINPTISAPGGGSHAMRSPSIKRGEDDQVSKMGDFCSTAKIPGVGVPAGTNLVPRPTSPWQDQMENPTT